mmetsp:Transcript_5743/g.20780  ORF Transcript_5743/g.20780 Transcript_5743/m.20780 type:complete len:280 (-) Transcript_5743:2811-3650(-)
MSSAWAKLFNFSVTEEETSPMFALNNSTASRFELSSISLRLAGLPPAACAQTSYIALRDVVIAARSPETLLVSTFSIVQFAGGWGLAGAAGRGGGACCCGCVGAKGCGVGVMPIGTCGLNADCGGGACPYVGCCCGGGGALEYDCEGGGGGALEPYAGGSAGRWGMEGGGAVGVGLNIAACGVAVGGGGGARCCCCCGGAPPIPPCWYCCCCDCIGVGTIIPGIIGAPWGGCEGPAPYAGCDAPIVPAATAAATEYAGVIPGPDACIGACALGYEACAE